MYQYILVHITVCIRMYLYLLVCKVLYLWVHAIKVSLGKLEGVASGTHYKLHPGTAQTPTQHSQRLSRYHPQHAPAETRQNITMDQYMPVHTRIY
jgi:hypothetical protein